MSVTQLDKKQFWDSAKPMLADFPQAAHALAVDHAEDQGLTGLQKRVSVFYHAQRIAGLRQTFGSAALIRAALGSRETGPELLQKLAFPSPTVRHI